MFALRVSAQITLGTDANFGVLGASTVTNTGNTVIVGDLGVYPGNEISGFPPGVVIGTLQSANCPAVTAQGDAFTAFTDINIRASTATLTGEDLGGKILVAGTYFYDTSAQLTGQLKLDGQNNPDSQFIFQIGTTLTTASASSIILVNGAKGCNVFWAVGSSATLGATTIFLGNIVAQQSITASNGASVNGGLYALVAAVSLSKNAINRQLCLPLQTSSTSFVPATTR